MLKLHIVLFTMLAALAGSINAGPLDINTADAAMLAAAIEGVGEKKAERIVQHRERYGPFTSVDELAEVTGIGAATVQRNRQKLTVSPAPGSAGATGY